MEVLYEHCAGLDVHKKEVVACVVHSGPAGTTRKVTRTFSTMVPDLERLRDWLVQEGCCHAAMEATGVYWRPVYNVLEEQLALLVVNAEHLKKVPGRKTDVKDAEWIATLLRHGLMQGSLIPPRSQRELRPHPVSYLAHPGQSPRRQPAAEDFGRGEHQTGQRHLGYNGCLRPAHARRPASR